MASSLPSFESFGSPVKPGSSMIHLCRSVKRTVSGSTFGCFSESWMPISSALSQSNVGGIDPLVISKKERKQEKEPARRRRCSMLRFFRVVFVPLGNLDDDIFRAVGDALAT